MSPAAVFARMSIPPDHPAATRVAGMSQAARLLAPSSSPIAAADRKTNTHASLAEGSKRNVSEWR